MTIYEYVSDCRLWQSVCVTADPDQPSSFTLYLYPPLLPVCVQTVSCSNVQPSSCVFCSCLGLSCLDSDLDIGLYLACQIGFVCRIGQNPCIRPNINLVILWIVACSHSAGVLSSLGPNQTLYIKNADSLLVWKVKPHGIYIRCSTTEICWRHAHLKL